MRKAQSTEGGRGADAPPLPNVMSVCYYYPSPVGGTDIGHHGYHSLGLDTKHFSKYSCLFHWFLTAILWCRHWYSLPSKMRTLWPSEVKEFAQHYVDGKRWGQRSTSRHLAPRPGSSLLCTLAMSRGEWERVPWIAEAMQGKRKAIGDAQSPVGQLLQWLQWITTWKESQNRKVTHLEHMIATIACRFFGFRTLIRKPRT